MKHQDSLNEFTRRLGELSATAEGSSAMQLYDVHSIAENLVLGLLKELYGWKRLRNVNVEERRNFPGIDLADDQAGIAVQVTATPTLDKVKGTMQTFLAHGLDAKYKRLVVYVLTRKQESYSQPAIDKIVEGRIQFDCRSDILDFRDLCSVAAHLPPRSVANALEVLRVYMRGGIATGLSEADYDPPQSSTESISLNAVEVFFPSTLYVADVLPDALSSTEKRPKNERKAFREHLRLLGIHAPSDVELHSKQLIAFHSLDDSHGPFAKFIDLGTVTTLRPSEFYSVDIGRERVFKSLLRFTLQQKLYRQGVHWKHEEGLFIFVPLDGGDIREEHWTGRKAASRRVFERTRNNKDPAKTLICKHFAFSVDFFSEGPRWFMSLTPDWFFSWGEDYKRSAYADERISWLKRREVNRTVMDHFRFITSWLRNLDQDDLFASGTSPSTLMSFGDAVQLGGHPALPDAEWLPANSVEIGESLFEDVQR